MYNLISTPFITVINQNQESFLATTTTSMSPLGMCSLIKNVKTITTPPDWSTTLSTNNKDLSPNGTISNENSDDHFNRHLENIIVTDLSKQLEEEQQHDDNDDNKTNENEDDDDDTVDPNDEPKVFQVEDVDLPSLITQNLKITNTNLFNAKVI